MIKAAKLSTGEHIIGNFKVASNNTENVGYVVTNPYTILFYEGAETENLQFLSESDENNADIKVVNHVYFEKWIPYSADNFFIIDYDWVMTFYEPLDEIKKSYIEKFGE